MIADISTRQSYSPIMTFTRKELLELEYETTLENSPLTATPLYMSGQYVEAISQDDQLHCAYKEAYESMCSIENSDEWVPMTDLTFGSGPHSSKDYQNLWDVHEMYYDMVAFESDHNAQMIAASGTDSVAMPIDITTRGANYSTGDGVLGKVYIPKKLEHHLKSGTHMCKLQYNGCETARTEYGIRMPWKCVYVYS